MPLPSTSPSLFYSIATRDSINETEDNIGGDEDKEVRIEDETKGIGRFRILQMKILDKIHSLFQFSFSPSKREGEKGGEKDEKKPKSNGGRKNDRENNEKLKNQDIKKKAGKQLNSKQRKEEKEEKEESSKAETLFILSHKGNERDRKDEKGREMKKSMKSCTWKHLSSAVLVCC
jgi:hypothetical protein